jgi:hypothetical protein
VERLEQTTVPLEEMEARAHFTPSLQQVVEVLEQQLMVLLLRYLKFVEEKLVDLVVEVQVKVQLIVAEVQHQLVKVSQVAMG